MRSRNSFLQVTFKQQHTLIIVILCNILFNISALFCNDDTLSMLKLGLKLTVLHV